MQEAQASCKKFWYSSN